MAFSSFALPYLWFLRMISLKSMSMKHGGYNNKASNYQIYYILVIRDRFLPTFASDSTSIPEKLSKYLM
jgi:hypothetical protein